MQIFSLNLNIGEEHATLGARATPPECTRMLCARAAGCVLRTL